LDTTFNFTGSIYLPKENSKMVFFKESSFEDKQTKKSIPSLALNFAVKESDSNMQFLSLYSGQYTQDINTMDKDGNKIQVPYENRFDKEILDTVSNFRKYSVDLSDANMKQALRAAISSGDYSLVTQQYGATDEDSARRLLKSANESRVSFITQADFIRYLAEHLPSYQGKITVTGRYSRRYYNGKYSDNFNPTNIYSVPDDTKNKLSLRMDLFYNKDCVDKTDLETKKKIFIDGYISQYVSAHKENQYFPQQVIFDISVYKPDKPRHQRLLDYRMSYIDTDSETYVHIPWEVRLINGAETVEFTEDLLTPQQRVQYELGLKTLDDFKPRGNIYGERIREYRLVDPQLSGDFADGLVDTEIMPEEFAEMMYKPMQTVSIEAELKTPAVKPVAVSAEDDLDDEDLF